jgi:asparagine synthase (glutamine-hydrolysing)
MCGIAGVIGANDGSVRLAAMLDAMPHRGPDGRGDVVFPSGAAGMVRLALVDLRERSQQPIWNATQDVCVLLNGEIYNYRAQRARLKENGVCFKTTGDAEVVLQLFLEDETGFVDRLRGMFAIAMIDFRNAGSDAPPTVTLARDPFGMKPLYVVHTDGAQPVFAFASEQRALVAGGVVDGAIRAEAVSLFLRHGFVPQTTSWLDHVAMLPAGHTLRFDPRQPQGTRSATRKFYALSAPPPPSTRSTDLQSAAEQLRVLLDDSIALHAFADAKVGAFLSGGLDSAVVTALMRNHVSDLQTFTMVFPDVVGADEGVLAARTAEALDVPMTRVEATMHDVGAAFDGYVRALDQPSIDGFNTWLVSRGAAEKVKGVLSGVGGDEWFAGYGVARRMQAMLHAQPAWVTAAAGVLPLLQRSRRPRLPLGIEEKLDALKSRSSLPLRWQHAHQVFSERTVASLTGRSYRQGSIASASVANETALDLCLDLDVHVYLKDQLLRDADVMSMAHSLELRMPLVDTHIAAFARALPDDHRLAPSPAGVPLSYRATGAKRVLWESVKDVLPPHLVDEPKRGFALPYRAWLHGPLKERVRGLFDGGAHRAGIVDNRAFRSVSRALTDDKNAALTFPQQWALLVLDGMCRDRLPPSRFDTLVIARENA